MSETKSDPKAIAATVARLPSSAAERYGELVATRTKAGSGWHELTPTLKVKRSAINDRYAGLFDSMYG